MFKRLMSISILVLGLFFLQKNVLFSQDSLSVGAWETERHYLSFSYGLRNIVAWTVQQERPEGTMTPVGPFFGKYEFSLTPILGVGLVFSFMKINYNAGRAVMDWRAYSFLYRFNVHLLREHPKADLYWGIGIGARKITCYTTDNSLCTISFFQEFPLAFETTLGFRYFFTPKIGFFSEVGAANAILQFGTVLKF